MSENGGYCVLIKKEKEKEKEMETNFEFIVRFDDDSTKSFKEFGVYDVDERMEEIYREYVRLGVYGVSARPLTDDE